MSATPTPHAGRALYEQFAGAMAYVAVRGKDGQEGIGSAFHVGEGVFVTARHVVEDKTIREIATFAPVDVPLEGEAAEKSLVTIRKGDKEVKVHTVRPAVLQLSAGPFYHPEKEIDVAVFKVEAVDPLTPIVPLGSHLDDWLGQDDFVLVDVVIFGFPPVPFASGPHLVAARGQVNALIDLRHTKHVHFIVSATPRGGFSGGLAVTDSGFALGLITQSLLNDNLPEQLGFMAVLSVEPIYVCLAEHRLLPAIQAEAWAGFWNTESISYYPKGTDVSKGGVMAAQVEWLNDGREQRFEVLCPDAGVADEAVTAILSGLKEFAPKARAKDDKVTLVELGRQNASPDELLRAGNAAASVLDRAGYVRMQAAKAGA